MIAEFLMAFRCEWLKRRRSHGAWLIVIGALFTPAIVVVARLVRHERLDALYAAPDFWLSLWKSSWESMAIFFLPIVAILATSLVVQIEVRNNAWKQVHTLPLRRVTIYFAKLAVIVLMLVQFLVLFDASVYLSAIVPWLVVGRVPYPLAPIPWHAFAGDTATYFIGCLPIVAGQYLLSMRFDNFLLSIGIGFLAWVGALAALSWRHADIVPYAYTMLIYLKDASATHAAVSAPDVRLGATAWSVALVGAGYRLFAAKKDSG